MRSFIFYPEWRDAINGLKKEEDRLALMNIIMDYGVTGAYHTTSELAETIFLSLIKTRIDVAQANYQEKVRLGETGGRKKKVSSETIEVLARDGLSAADIADKL